MFDYVSSEIQTFKGYLYPNSSIDTAKNMNVELCPTLNYLTKLDYFNLINYEIICYLIWIIII